MKETIMISAQKIFLQVGKVLPHTARVSKGLNSRYCFKNDQMWMTTK